MIPDGLVGRGEAPGHTEHGIGIVIAEKPYGYMYTDGSADWTEEEFPLYEIASKHTEWIRQDAQRILSVEQFEMVIDTHPALRLIVRYLCSTSQKKVHDYVFTRNYGHIYTVALLADYEKYEVYKTTVERIMDTFQFKEWPCQ
jgi:hypothetical protein